MTTPPHRPRPTGHDIAQRSTFSPAPDGLPLSGPVSGARSLGCPGSEPLLPPSVSDVSDGPGSPASAVTAVAAPLRWMYILTPARTSRLTPPARTSMTVGEIAETLTVKDISGPYGVPSFVKSCAVIWTWPVALAAAGNLTDWLCPPSTL